MVTGSVSYCFYHSPVGRLVLAEHEQQLAGLWFEDCLEEAHRKRIDFSGDRVVNASASQNVIFIQTVGQLDEYFSGQRKSFSIPLQARGTAFQMKVWQALRQIPYSETWSYQQLAIYLGDERAVRAVGTANGRNPISIIIPCHRVIGKDGRLTGYAGGLARKEYLLNLEKNK